MKRIDRSEVEGLLNAGKRGTIFCTIFLASPQDGSMRKTDNPFHGKGLLKEVALNGAVGGDYGAGVNRLAAKEGKPAREAKGRKWGKLDADRKFVRHTNKEGVAKVYVQMLVRSSTDPVYRIGKDEIPADSIKPFQYEKGKSSTQEDLDGEIICRDVSLENVLMIRYKGEDYLVADLEPMTKPESLTAAKVNARVDALIAEMCDLKRLLIEGEILAD